MVNKKILVMGLPGAGKTTLATALSKRLKAVHFNADDVRATISSDLGFSVADRLKQAERMGWLCDKVKASGNVAVADFVCPTADTRKAFGDCFVIWVDRIKESRYEDTNRLFESPEHYDIRLEGGATVDEWIESILAVLQPSTTPLRSAPSKSGPRFDFAIIGGQKCSSTFLHHLLAEHPNIHIPENEITIFNDRNFSQALVDDYLDTKLRPHTGENIITGIKRPDLMYYYSCAARLYEHNPAMKFFVILRHPVDRAISAIYHYISYGMLPYSGINAAIDWIAAGNYHKSHRATEILEYSRFARYIRMYESLFPAEQINVFKAGELRADLKGRMRKTLDFLGVRGECEYSDDFLGRNYQKTYRSPELLEVQNAIEQTKSVVNIAGVKYEYKQYELGFMDKLRLNGLLKKKDKILSRLSEKVFEGEEIKPDSRAKLGALLADEVEFYESHA